jgi:NAD+ synthetase
MPCHSSLGSITRANELIDTLNLRAFHVDLTSAFESIASQVGGVQRSNASDGALRSCLRAPTLDFVAKLTNGIIVGTGNRDEDEMTRYFQKRGDGAVDCSPIAKLHKSEVYQLLWWLGCPESIISATPSADLWGPDSGQEDEKEVGMTYQEIEWGICVLVDDARGFRGRLNSAGDERMLRRYFSERQLFVLRTLDRMDIVSRHKAEMPPVFDIRWKHSEYFL